ncbi:MAG: tRNA uridine(34) 5-carboxymethylaminomethyl modification radical SAM/GNAT enzyme Elp3 [Thermoplasmata archaeon]|nr:tRNA uridine(34) 5-carboxymethylaminomethyl modification radical SAM/GNAT enzyme Elp3 [Thermoplasmata archaeon]
MIDAGKLLADLVIEKNIQDHEEYEKLKMYISKKYHVSPPKNSEVIKNIPDDLKEKFLSILVRKPSRTLSGVAVIAAMTSPFPCPHGKCIYCPGGVEYNTAQSYTGHEPAALRAIMNDYDPYKQVKSRIEQLQAIGHSTSKIDGIVMGGTVTARSEEYQKYFVKGMYDAMNGFTSKNVHESMLYNEISDNRMIGLTFETRPDWFYEREIDIALDLGVTRVELGVQSVFDDILNLVHRGHGQMEIIKSTQLAKDAGLKICYHMMPGLPGSSPEKDLESFKKIFNDENYRPDMLKIYPTLVVENSELYKWWKEGKYRPYHDDDFLDLLIEIKKIVPRWVRIQRVERDIPVPLIVDGIRRSDIRDLAYNKMKSMGLHCNCIRCREIGRKYEKGEILKEPEIKMNRFDYDASKGKEIFLSFDDVKNDAIIGYLRLRIPSEFAHRKEVFQSSMVRELKVLGPEVPVNKIYSNAFQHKGYGKMLMEEAEKISREEFDKKYMLVNSGVGAIEYYRKLGYEKYGPYVRKLIL